MADKARDHPPKVDNVTQLQSKIDDLSVMFFTYLGIIQRDAPPTGRHPDEKDEELESDQAMRKQLAEKMPARARDIVCTSREIDALLVEIEAKSKAYVGKEHALLDNANFESAQAGDEMTEAVDDASKLLTSVREIISARETDP